MKYLKLIPLIFLPGLVFAQPAQRVIFVTSDPVGACNNGAPLEWNSNTSTLWGCSSNVWGKIGGSSVITGSQTVSYTFTGSETNHEAAFNHAQVSTLTPNWDCFGPTSQALGLQIGYNEITPGTLTTSYIRDTVAETVTCQFSGGAITNSATQINGAAVPSSTTVIGTNSSSQLIAASLQGNGAKVQLSTGSTTTNHCVQFDASGNTVDAGAACGSGGGGSSLTTTVTNTATVTVTGTVTSYINNRSAGVTYNLISATGGSNAPQFCFSNDTGITAQITLQLATGDKIDTNGVLNATAGGTITSPSSALGNRYCLEGWGTNLWKATASFNNWTPN